MADIKGKNIIGGNVENVGNVILGDGVVIHQYQKGKAPLDYLKDLPALPADLGYPPEPYLGLHWFTRDKARVFFGRGDKIKQLYDAITDPLRTKVNFLYGQSGVGKSSLLHAGLLPRLETGRTVFYLRRDFEQGLVAQVETILSTAPDDDKSLVVILDQVEELLTQPNHELDKEALNLARLIAARSEVSWLLGFRKEYLAELTTLFKGVGVEPGLNYLEPLQHYHILEAVEGVSRDPGCQERYHLSLEDGVAEAIAHDISRDQDAHQAPALQVLMTKLWRVATGSNEMDERLKKVSRQLEAEGRKSSRNEPAITRRHFELLVAEGGLLMDEFLGEQLESIGATHPDWQESGILLGILRYFTTDLGTARARNREEVEKEYAQVPDLKLLLDRLIDSYLIFKAGNAGDDGSLRLAHDALAPLIRARHLHAQTPGPKALTILENRLINHPDPKVAPLDGTDLKTVLSGKTGMRAWREDEQVLIAVSRAKKRRRRFLQWLAIGLITVLGLAIAYAGYRNYKLLQEQNAQLLENQADQLTDDPLAQLKAYQQSLENSEQQDDRRRKYYDVYRQHIFPKTLLPADELCYFGVFDKNAENLILHKRQGEKYTTERYRFDAANRTLEFAYALDEGIHAEQNTLLISADGETVVSGGYDHEIHRWGMSGKKKPIYELPDQHSIQHLAVSPDGRYAVTNYLGEETVQFHDLEEGAVLAQVTLNARPTTIEFVAGLEVVLIGTEGLEILSYDWNGKFIKSLPSMPRPAVGFAYDADLSILFVNCQVLVYQIDYAAGKWSLGKVFADKGIVGYHEIGLSPRGKFVLLRHSEEIYLYRRPRLGDNFPNEKIKLPGSFFATRFTANGDGLLTVGLDSGVQLWPLDYSAPLYSHGIEYAFNTMERGHLPGSLVFGTSADNLIFEPDLGKAPAEKFAVGHESNAVTAVAAKAEKIFSGDEFGRLFFHSAEARQSKKAVVSVSSERVNELLLDEDGTLGFSDHNRGLITLWDPNTRDTVKTIYRGSYLSMALSPDGKKLVVLLPDGTLDVREAGDWEVKLTLDTENQDMNYVGFLNNETLLLSDDDGYGMYTLTGKSIDWVPDFKVRKVLHNRPGTPGPPLALLGYRVRILDASGYGYLEVEYPYGGVKDALLDGEYLYTYDLTTVDRWKVDRPGPDEFLRGN